jgi:type IV pilus assembly protein PilF
MSERSMSMRKTLAFVAVFALLQACVSETTKGDKPPTKNEAAVANMNLGAGYLQQGKPELAIDRLQRAIKQDPKLADAHTTLALAYDQLGSPSEAEDHYKKATQLEPNNSSAANAYASFLCRQKRWNDAEPYFQRAVANLTYQTPEVAFTNAGICALGAGDHAKAEENFRAALSRNPRYADALEGMLDTSFQDKNYLQARAFYERYAEVRKPDAAKLMMCFSIEQGLGNRDGANRCAARLREDFPDSAEAKQVQQLQTSNGR